MEQTTPSHLVERASEQDLILARNLAMSHNQNFDEITILNREAWIMMAIQLNCPHPEDMIWPAVLSFDKGEKIAVASKMCWNCRHVFDSVRPNESQIKNAHWLADLYWGKTWTELSQREKYQVVYEAVTASNN